MSNISNRFPSNPTNGQTFTRFGRPFVYNATLGVWQARAPVAVRQDLAAVATDIVPSAPGEVSLGSPIKPFSAAHIEGSLFLNGREVTDSDILNFDLNIEPEILAIQVSAPFAGHGDLWLWTWTASTLPYSRINITNSPQLNVPLYKQGTYVIDNFAGREIYGPMTQTHTLYLKWIDGAGTQNVVDWVTSSVTTTRHPQINDGEITEVQRLSLVVPANVVPPTLVPPTVSYNVSFTTPGAYTFMGANMGNNVTLGPFYRGGTYTFNLGASLAGHPFYLTTDNGTNFVSGQYVGEYTNGVVGSRNQSGTLVFTVPQNAPDTLFYQCGVHGPMRGAITIKDLEVEVNTNGNYVLYFQHTKEGHKTPVEIRPIPSLVDQMCLVYDQANNKFVPQDLATYVERTPLFRNKIQEVAGTATLVAPDGVPIVPTVSIVDDASYLPLVGNKDGDITYASDNQTLYIWSRNAWRSTKAQTSTYTKSYRYSGELGVNQGSLRFYFRQPTVCERIDMFVGTASAGANIAVDIVKNGTSVQTVTLLAGSNSNLGIPSNLNFIAGDFITINITQVGSTTPGSDLYMILTFR